MLSDKKMLEKEKKMLDIILIIRKLESSNITLTLVKVKFLYIYII